MTTSDTPSDEDRANYTAWVASRPEPVKTMASRLFPWQLYQHRQTGQLVYVTSFNEDGTVTMRVVGHSDETLNMINAAMPFGVFGVNPDDLVEHP